MNAEEVARKMKTKKTFGNHKKKHNEERRLVKLDTHMTHRRQDRRKQ